VKVLAIDVGGTNVKMLATGQKQPLKFSSGPDLVPRSMVDQVKKLTAQWEYDVVSIGIPGPFLLGHLIVDPSNLGPGWVGFDFEAAFGCPVKTMNDAAMQALGSYKERSMIFLGFGTGLGAAFVIDGVAESREIAHLPYKKKTFEDYVGRKALEKLGKKKWRKNVNEIVTRLVAALKPDDIVIGGGNAKKLKKLPKGCRLGDNGNAFLGGFRLWNSESRRGGGPVIRIPETHPRREEERNDTSKQIVGQKSKRNDPARR
jgi:polyphosphate glucokinase